MSGTSLDGVDGVIVDFSNKKPELLHSIYLPYPEKLQEDIRQLCHPGENEITRLGALDNRLGQFYADTVLKLLSQADLTPGDISAIGCHGQTVRHSPPTETQGPGFTLQIGNPNLVSCKTGISTVADFRRMDMALGGHGAPLVPAFHQVLFQDETHNRVILNVGGIANITYLPANGNPCGFDTGPGNTLLDSWIRKHRNKGFDDNGGWATSGQTDAYLLDKLLGDPYFSKAAPKSTGPEYFNLQWLETALADFAHLQPEDVQATLVKLTSRSIAGAISSLLPALPEAIYVCGGGIHNRVLMQSLSDEMPFLKTLDSTSTLGLDPDWVEATAFAWLAKRRMEGLPGNITAVTGAASEAVLGAIYHP